MTQPVKLPLETISESYFGIPAALVLSQLLAYVPRKAEEEDNSTTWGPCHPRGRAGWNSRLLALAWPSPQVVAIGE